MPEETVTQTPAVETPVAATEGAKPAQEIKKDTPAEKPAVSGEKPAEKPVESASKSTLLGGEEGKEESKEEGKEVKKEIADVPEKYEIKAPEGMKVDQNLLDALSPVFKEIGISNAQAQKLADAYAPVIKQASEAQHKQAMEAFDKQIEDWGKETKAMLGADGSKALAPAARFITQFAGKDAPAVKQLLNDTGLGNHPLIVKMLIAAGKSISQDSFVEGGSPAGEGGQDASIKKFYPNSFGKT